jgi:hypothetical protein
MTSVTGGAHERPDVARAASDLDDRVLDRSRERAEKLTVEWLVPQLVHEARFILGCHGVVRGAEVVPGHRTILPKPGEPVGSLSGPLEEDLEGLGSS